MSVWAKHVGLFLPLGLHGGADHPPGQCGACPPGRRRPADRGEPERGRGFGSAGADEPPELAVGAPEGGQHGETKQVDTET